MIIAKSIHILSAFSCYEPIYEVSTYANSRKGGHGSNDTNTPVFNEFTSTGFLFSFFILCRFTAVLHLFLECKPVCPKIGSALPYHHLFQSIFIFSKLLCCLKGLHIGLVSMLMCLLLYLSLKAKVVCECITRFIELLTVCYGFLDNTKGGISGGKFSYH